MLELSWRWKRGYIPSDLAASELEPIVPWVAWEEEGESWFTCLILTKHIKDADSIRFHEVGNTRFDSFCELRKFTNQVERMGNGSLRF